ncbi:DUF4398 domain-containing protein [Sandaracinus amylolyticus]|uniref:DUF4398 domain-containing protein n=1 Tax=Sandaracinus amylolyticus TaxID=927083 RepID=UPI001F23D7E0|nr:DUF4398 domain-containing protein [Sandaracinus amylolyticus]UJR82088.1 Hypothetical protein I5071_41530 [Sandaracinus amylolyticus]
MTASTAAPRTVDDRPRAPRTFIVALACALLPACGPSLYTFQILPASSAVSQAEQAGAPEHAPYEYWTAHEYLEKAAEEANEGNYQDAIRFAERAREMGELAQEETSRRMRVSREDEAQ